MNRSTPLRTSALLHAVHGETRDMRLHLFYRRGRKKSCVPADGFRAPARGKRLSNLKPFSELTLSCEFGWSWPPGKRQRSLTAAILLGSSRGGATTRAHANTACARGPRSEALLYRTTLGCWFAARPLLGGNAADDKFSSSLDGQRRLALCEGGDDQRFNLWTS